MSLHLTVTVERGATVLQLRGTADAASISSRRIDLAAAAADAAFVVVDLDDTTVVGPQEARDLLAALRADPARVHVVARRNSVTSTLVQGRVHHTFAVHRSISDALTGVGWGRR